MDQKSEADIALMGTDAEPMSDETIITGISGRTYRAVDLVTEMRGKQEGVLTRMVAPVLPALIGLADAIGGGTADSTKVALDFAGIIAAIIEHQLHRRIIAVIYLPTEDRTFRLEDVEARMEDMADGFTVEECVGVLMRFFDGAGSSFRNTFGDSLAKIRGAAA